MSWRKDKVKAKIYRDMDVSLWAMWRLGISDRYPGLSVVIIISDKYCAVTGER